MTSRDILSARIAALEEQSGRLPALHALRERTVQEIARQQSALADVDAEIAAGDHARLILEELTGHADRVLASGTLVRSAPTPPEVDTPEDKAAAELAPEIPEAPASTDGPPDAALDQAADIPQDTPGPQPVVAGAPENDDAALAGEEGEPPLTVPQRVNAWVEGREPGEEFTAADCAKAVSAAYSTVSTCLAGMFRRGAFTRVEGTGVPGLPSTFRMPGAPAQEAPATPDAAFPTLSPRAAVLGFLRDHPTDEFTAEYLAQQLNLSEDAARSALNALVQTGAAEGDLKASPITYSRAGQLRPDERPAPGPFQEAAPSGPAPDRVALAEFPDRLSVDERSMFDQLRRAPAGLTRRVLGSYLNWSATRTDKIAAGLLRNGHVTEKGGRLSITDVQERVA